MADTITETRTAAEELRAAATTLRCDHSFPCQPPHGSIARPGACSKCGVHFLDALDVPDALTESLAKLLEGVADGLEAYGPTDDCGCVAEDSYHPAMNIARSINGTA